eukprot:1590591-Amphidinium_carterae.1
MGSWWMVRCHGSLHIFSSQVCTLRALIFMHEGIVWIKNKEADNNLQVTRMGNSKMVQTFEVSIDQGKSSA